MKMQKRIYIYLLLYQTFANAFDECIDLKPRPQCTKRIIKQNLKVNIKNVLRTTLKFMFKYCKLASQISI